MGFSRITMDLQFTQTQWLSKNRIDWEVVSVGQWEMTAVDVYIGDLLPVVCRHDFFACFIACWLFDIIGPSLPV